jgi:hypothetical protein
MTIKKNHFLYWISSLVLIFYIFFYYLISDINVLNLDYEAYSKIVLKYNLNLVFFNDGDHFDYLKITKSFFNEERNIESLFEALSKGAIRNDIIISYFFYLVSPSIDLIIPTVYLINFLILTTLYYYNYNLISESIIKKKILIFVLPFFLFAFFVPHINKEIFTLLFLYTSINYLNKPSFKRLLYVVIVCTIRLQFFFIIVPLIIFTFFKRLKVIYFLSFIYFVISAYFLHRFNIISYERLYLSHIFNMNNFTDINFFLILNFIKQFFIMFDLKLHLKEFFFSSRIEKFVFFIIAIHLTFTVIFNFKQLMVKSFYLNIKIKKFIFVIIAFILLCSIAPISSPRYLFMIYPIFLLCFYNFKIISNKKLPHH